MRQWRILIFFDSLREFNLGALLRNKLSAGDKTPHICPRIPDTFYMHVTAFEHHFTLEIQTPLTSQSQK